MTTYRTRKPYTRSELDHALRHAQSVLDHCATIADALQFDGVAMDLTECWKAILMMRREIEAKTDREIRRAGIRAQQ